MQLAPVEAPYVSSSAAPGGTTVPPYPGYSPTRFSSAAEAATYHTWRLERLSARERALTLLGRPENYKARRAGGRALLVGGAAMIVTSFGIYSLASASPPVEGSLDPRASIGLASAALCGVGMALGGIIWLSHLKRDNANRDEIAALKRERAQVGKELKRARRQTQQELGLSFDLERLQVKF
jgi:hypothetical protein